MSSIPAKVQKVLDDWGLKALEFESGSTPTSVLAAQKIGVAVGQIAKSLLFRDKKGGFHLVLMAGDTKVSSGKLKRLTGSEASMATPEETLAVTGFRVGGVCPFGVENVPVYLDQSLKRFDVLYPAAGNDASGVPVPYQKLLEIVGGRECEVASQGAPV